MPPCARPGRRRRRAPRAVRDDLVALRWASQREVNSRCSRARLRRAALDTLQNRHVDLSSLATSSSNNAGDGGDDEVGERGGVVGAHPGDLAAGGGGVTTAAERLRNLRQIDLAI